MLHSGYERLGMEVYSSIQKVVDDCRQDLNRPSCPLLRLAGLKEKAVQAAGRFGYEVVNADNLKDAYPACRGGGQVVYFSIYPDNAVVRRHLGAGGMAVFIREGKILAASGSRSKSITKTKANPWDVPEPNQLKDALAAAAGLMALGVQPDEVWDRSFRNQGLAYPEKLRNE